MRRGVIAFLLLAVVPTFGTGSDESRLAAAYADAGNDKKAELLYKRLLDQLGEPWQRAVVRYNLATLLLQENRYQEAAAAYRAIAVGSDPNPLFMQRLSFNFSLALLEQARRSAENEKLPLLDVEGALLALDELFRLNRDCRGEALCLAASSLQNRLLKRKKELLFEVLSDEEKLLLLQSGLNGLITEVEDLPVEEGHIERTRTAKAVAEALSWEPYWQEGGAFTEGIAALEAGRLEAARRLFLEASKELNEKIAVAFGDDALTEQLYRLSLGYKRTIEQQPLQPGYMEALYNLQHRISEHLESGALGEASAALKKAIAAAFKGEEGLARLSLVIAFREVRRTMWQMQPLKQDEAAAALERALQEQQTAIMLNQISVRYTLPEKEAVAAQADLLRRLLPFQEYLLAAEEKDYQVPLPLCPLWEEAVKLFNEGDAAATAAYSLLHAGDANRGLQKQEEALAKWKRALELMKQRPTEEKVNSQQKEKTEQLLRLLQQMEQDDRVPAKKEGVLKKGKKPW